MLTLAVARPQFFAKKGSDPRPAKRSKLRPKDVEQAIQQARNLCYNFEDTPACKVAWDRVEELSSELARQREKPILRIAQDLGISDATLHGWLKQADIDEGHADGLTTEERAELVQLRRANRVLTMENEILKRAAAFFARENVLPK